MLRLRKFFEQIEPMLLGADDIRLPTAAGRVLVFAMLLILVILQIEQQQTMYSEATIKHVSL